MMLWGVGRAAVHTATKSACRHFGSSCIVLPFRLELDSSIVLLSMTSLTTRSLYPTQEVVEAWGDLAAVLAWSKLPLEQFKHVAAALGDPDLEDVTEIAAMPLHFLTAAIATWVAEHKAAPLTQTRMARTFNAIRLRAGLSLEDGLLQPAAPSPSAVGQLSTVGTVSATPAVAGVKVKLSQVIDQAMDAEFESLQEAEVRELFSVFDTSYGGRPLPYEEPSGDQIKALQEVLSADRAPYADFAVWGPYGRRQAKLLKYQAMIWVGGTLQSRQLTGPHNFSAWRRCWRESGR